MEGERRMEVRREGGKEENIEAGKEGGMEEGGKE